MVALRKDDVLNFIIGDHLGSSSLTKDVAGNELASMLYKAWGETRHSTGTMNTDYEYAGQRNVTEIGLHIYNARWYDSSLGRFAQADTIVPSTQGVQGFDRYAYANNNPVRYTDPSGHGVDCGIGMGCVQDPPTITQQLTQYDINSSELTTQQKVTALKAAKNFGQFFYQEYGDQYGFTSAADAFKKITGGNILIILDNSRSDCITIGSTITCDAGSMTMKTFVHEYFHVFDKYYQSKGAQVGCGGACFASNNMQYEHYTEDRYTRDAYKCERDYFKCVSHPYNVQPYNFLEAFANAGESLVLGELDIDRANNGFASNDYGREVEGWMKQWMPTFLNGVVLP